MKEDAALSQSSQQVDLFTFTQGKCGCTTLGFMIVVHVARVCCIQSIPRDWLMLVEVYEVELEILYQYLMADLFFFYEYQGSSKVLDYYGYGDTGFERGCLYLTLANEYLANQLFLCQY